MPASEPAPQAHATPPPPPCSHDVSVSNVTFRQVLFKLYFCKVLVGFTGRACPPTLCPSRRGTDAPPSVTGTCHSSRNPGMTGVQEPLGCGSLGFNARPTAPPSSCPSSGTLVSPLPRCLPPGRNSNNLIRCQYSSYFCLFSTQIVGKWHHQMQLALVSFQGFKDVFTSSTVSPFLGPSGHMKLLEVRACPGKTQKCHTGSCP